MANTPFGLAVTSQDGPPIATHVPVVLPPGFDLSTTDTFVGRQLWSHMGRANRHWRAMVEQPEVLLIHSSSHGYVSPSLYERPVAVPTVDYAAVHLTGRVTLLDDDAAMDVVVQTVRQLEGTRKAEWDMTNSLDTFRRIIDGVVAFTIEITSEQAVFKLSQDMPAEIKHRVRDEFAGVSGQPVPGCPHTDLAALMDELPKEFTPGEHYPPIGCPAQSQENAQ